MKKVTTFIASFTLAVFAALILWGKLMPSNPDGFRIAAIYLIAPAVSFVATMLITMEYRYYGFLSVAVCAVLSLALPMAVYGTADYIILIVTGLIVPLIGAGVGALCCKSEQKLRISYHTLGTALNAGYAVAGVICEVAAIVVAAFAFAGEGKEGAFTAFLLISVLVLMALNFLLNLIPYFCFKKALGLNVFKMFLPTICTTGVIIAAVVTISLLQ